MPSVSGTPTIGGLYQPTEAEKQNVTGAQNMDMNDFYKLMAAQMQYQNPDDPMDTSAMMASMLQVQVIQSLSSVTEAVMQMQYASATTYAASLQGQDVKVAKVDKFGQPTGEYVTGKVSGVILGSNPLVIVNGDQYPLSQIVSLGEDGKKGEESKPVEPDKPVESDKPVENDKPVESDKPAEETENQPAEPEEGLTE